MEVQVSKENICINKLVAQKKELLSIHNDIIVPDSKPDILNTINVTGNVCILKKEVMEDKVKIDGSINTYVMYLPDSKDDNLRALNCVLDFSENIAVPGAKEGMMLVIKSEIKSLDCKVINGRKISITANVEFNIKVYTNENVDIINSINNIEHIQTLEETFNVNSLVGTGKTTVYAKDTLNIDSIDELAEILKVNLNLINKDMKISYNKILAKAEIETKIMYLTEDNRIGRVNGKIPIVGFIDLQNISEDNMCDIVYELKNLQIRPNPAEEHSIYVEIEMEVCAEAYEKKQINLIQDLYSPVMPLNFTQKNILSSSERMDFTKDFTIKEKVKISDAIEGDLVDVQVDASLVNTQITNSKIVYSGDLNLNMIFSNSNSLYSRVAKIPFELSLDNVANTDKIDIETQITIGETNFDMQNNQEIEAEIDMEIYTKINQNANMNIIENIEVSEDSNQGAGDYDSLILYIVRPGDTLWKIAKRFNSTVEEIARMNGIENANKIDVGQKLYIPKFNYTRKENKQNEEQPTYV